MKPETLNKKRKREIDTLYYYLWFANHYSVLAKLNYLNRFGIDEHTSQILYKMKDIKLRLAIKKAIKIEISVIYEPLQKIVYFELIQGQVSFHVTWNEKNIPDGLKIIERYGWNGLNNSREIINRYFSENTKPKIQFKYVPPYIKRQWKKNKQMPKSLESFLLL